MWRGQGTLFQVEKLDKKSFNEKAAELFAGGIAVVVDIVEANYFQKVHGVCIQAPITTNQTKVTGMNIFQPSRMI